MTKDGPRVAARKNDKPTYDLANADEKVFPLIGLWIVRWRFWNVIKISPSA